MKPKFSRSQLRSRSMHTVAVLILLACGAGCMTAKPRSNVTPTVKPDIAVSYDQMRLRMRSLVDPMCGRLEQAADAISAASTDRDIQLAALTWKIDAVPALREALFQPDPFTAALDTLVLCNQMANFFETGDGQQALGVAAAQAAASCRTMEEDFYQVLASATYSGNPPNVRAFAKQWAAEHPIRHSIADRESILARSFEREISDFTAGAAIAEVTTTLDDLVRKLEVYSDQLFRQARWEAERIKLEWVSELRIDQAIPLAERAVKSADQAVATVERVAPSIERAVAVAQDTPRLIAVEREAAIKAMHEEVTRAIQVAQDERIAVLEQLAKERGIVMRELNESITEHRQQITKDAEQITLNRIDYAVQRLTRLVTVTLSAVGAALLLGLFLVRWIFVQRPGVRHI